jgi:hypothetical protein
VKEGWTSTAIEAQKRARRRACSRGVTRAHGGARRVLHAPLARFASSSGGAPVERESPRVGSVPDSAAPPRGPSRARKRSERCRAWLQRPSRFARRRRPWSCCCSGSRRDVADLRGLTSARSKRRRARSGADRRVRSYYATNVAGRLDAQHPAKAVHNFARCPARSRSATLSLLGDSISRKDGSVRYRLSRRGRSGPPHAFDDFDRDALARLSDQPDQPVWELRGGPASRACGWRPHPHDRSASTATTRTDSLGRTGSPATCAGSGDSIRRPISQRPVVSLASATCVRRTLAAWLLHASGASRPCCATSPPARPLPLPAA